MEDLREVTGMASHDSPSKENTEKNYALIVEILFVKHFYTYVWCQKEMYSIRVYVSVLRFSGLSIKFCCIFCES